MKDKERIIIQKIIGYIEDISEYIENIDETEFYSDKKTMTACAFSLSQIGELAKELDDATINNIKEIPWKSIKGMRNRIVHDYDNVDLSVLWATITNDLPELREKLVKIIEK